MVGQRVHATVGHVQVDGQSVGQCFLSVFVWMFVHFFVLCEEGVI